MARRGEPIRPQDAHGRNLWLFDVERGTGDPLTQGRQWNRSPTFSRDGNDLLYHAENADHVGFRVLSLGNADDNAPASPGGIYSGSLPRPRRPHVVATQWLHGIFDEFLSHLFVIV